MECIKAHNAISQIWVSYDIVIGVCGVRLYVFDALNEDAFRVLNNVQYHKNNVGEGLYRPSFGYMGSHALLISRDKLSYVEACNSLIVMHLY
jgi:hypothetical protein